MTTHGAERKGQKLVDSTVEMTQRGAVAGNGRLWFSLSWWLAGLAAVLYLATLNHWVTLNSLAATARVAGWDWRPALSQPLWWLLTFPCRWLPATAVPLALNLFAAACATLTLVLLARSAALLPIDRVEHPAASALPLPRVLANAPGAVLAVTLAVAALGMQLSFWENATAASVEMLDLLLFAAVIRCLLGYRVQPRAAWLDRAALTAGLAMANSWALVAFLPLFIVAVLWLRPLNLFRLAFYWDIEQNGWRSALPNLAKDLRFLGRVTGWGVAGGALLLLGPALAAFSPEPLMGFGEAVRAVGVTYKHLLLETARFLWRTHRESGAVLLAVGLLPVLLLCIRWKTFGSVRDRVELEPVSLVFIASHAGLLWVCLWVMFDPPFSPRQVGQRIGLAVPFLPLYYLIALSVGYYAGFLLLVAHGLAQRRRRLLRTLGQSGRYVAGAVLALVCGGLVYKNLDAIRVTNGPHLERFAGWLAEALPPEPTLVLSDDPVRLTVLRAALVRDMRAPQCVPVHVTALPQPAYRRHLARQYPHQWTDPSLHVNADGNAAPRRGAPFLNTAGCFQLLLHLARSNRLFCLQPSFGVLLEQFDLHPRGLLFEMKPLPAGGFGGLPLSAAELQQNAVFWQRVRTGGIPPVRRLVHTPAANRPGWEKRLLAMGHLEMPVPGVVRLLAQWYSTAATAWGTYLQRHDRWQEAADWFTVAEQLQPANLAAVVNLECNRNRQAGIPLTVTRPRAIQDYLDQIRNWTPLLTEIGVFDEPSACYHLAMNLAEGQLFRQACRQMERVTQLAPGYLPARIRFAQLLNRCQLPDRALAVAAEVEAHPARERLGMQGDVELAFVQAQSWFALTNHGRAHGRLMELLNRYPGDAAVLDQTVAVLAANRDFTNALRLADERVRLAQDDPYAHIYKGTLAVMAGEFSNAITSLTRALALTNALPARVNRAFAYMYTGELDAAEADYRALLRDHPTDHQAWRGLAEIALRRQDTNAAVYYYEQFLAHARPDSEEARWVAARLKQLRATSR